MKEREEFSFQVTYRSKCPWQLKMVGYAGEALPSCVVFDAVTGLLKGKFVDRGEHMLTFVIEGETGHIVTWGDLKIKVTPSRFQPKSLAGETFYQLQIP